MRLANLCGPMTSFRSLLPFAAVGTLATVLSGCPIWDEGDYYDDGCYDECSCYGECGSPCSTQSQCGSEEVCGADNQCHFGECDTWGCPIGYVCDAKLECVPDGQLGGFGGGDEGGAGGGGGGTEAVYCGNPDDCGALQYCAPDGTCHDGDCTADGCIYGFICDELPESPVCVRENPNGCGSDGDCADPADKCVSGECTPPADLCFDQTQCPSGDVCADGKCVPSCAGGDTCPSSYSCTSGVELCTTPVLACTITNDCGGFDNVCVEGTCVPRSIDGFCDADSIWVDNGCIPNQSASFVCTTDGVQDVCASGSICLHHSCYISCEAPNQTACDGLPEIDQCKDVTTPSGAHSVCGTEENLGDECDPTTQTACADGFICVDGYCH